MQNFREWFEEKHGFKYPAVPHEMAYVVNKRIAEAMADYVDYIAKASKLPGIPIQVLNLVVAADKIAPWVSASLSELQAGHTGEYERDAEAFLASIIALKEKMGLK